MAQQKIDIVDQSFEIMHNKFVMSTEQWRNFTIDDLQVDIQHWQILKLFEGEYFHPSVLQNVPKDTGGIYIYYIDCPVIKQLGSYIMYIGKAEKCETHSLNKRIRSYYSNYKNGNERAKITRLFDRWKDYIMLAYLPIKESDEIISELEKRLVDALIPPCNKVFYSPQVRKKMAMFQ